MKLPDFYTDWRIVAGFALIVLGVANWVTGRIHAQEYGRIIAASSVVAADESYRSFDELDPHSGGEVLAPFSNAQRRLSYATARMDFYHAAFLTGQALVLAGVVLMLIGFIAIIQRDYRHIQRRLRASLTDHAPPRAH